MVGRDESRKIDHHHLFCAQCGILTLRIASLIISAGTRQSRVAIKIKCLQNLCESVVVDIGSNTHLCRRHGTGRQQPSSASQQR